MLKEPGLLQRLSSLAEPLDKTVLYDIASSIRHQLDTDQFDHLVKVDSGYFKGTSLLWWVLRVAHLQPDLISQVAHKAARFNLAFDLSNCAEDGTDLVTLAMCEFRDKQHHYVTLDELILSKTYDDHIVSAKLDLLEKLGISQYELDPSTITSGELKGWNFVGIALHRLSKNANAAWNFLKKQGVCQTLVVQCLLTETGYANPLLVALTDLAEKRGSSLEALKSLPLTKHHVDFHVTLTDPNSNFYGFDPLGLAIVAMSNRMPEGLSYLKDTLDISASDINFDMRAQAGYYQGYGHMSLAMEALHQTKKPDVIDFLQSLSVRLDGIDFSDMPARSHPVWLAMLNAANERPAGLHFLKAAGVGEVDWNLTPTSGIYAGMSIVWLAFHGLMSCSFDGLDFILRYSPSLENIDLSASAKGSLFAYETMLNIDQNGLPRDMEGQVSTKSVSILSMIHYFITNLANNLETLGDPEKIDKFIKLVVMIPITAFCPQSTSDLNSLFLAVVHEDDYAALDRELKRICSIRSGSYITSKRALLFLLLSSLVALDSFEVQKEQVFENLMRAISNLLEQVGQLYPEFYYHVGTILMTHNQFEFAIDYLNHIEPLQPYYTDAQFQLAQHFNNQIESIGDKHFMLALHHAINAGTSGEAIRMMLVLRYCGVRVHGTPAYWINEYPILQLVPAAGLSTKIYLNLMLSQLELLQSPDEIQPSPAKRLKSMSFLANNNKTKSDKDATSTQNFKPKL